MTVDSAITAEPATPGLDDREVIHRHSRVVRITHWINVVTLALLLMSGLQIFNAYPRLHVGAFGADFDKAWLDIGAVHSGTPNARGYVSLFGHAIDTTGVFGLSASSDGGLEPRGFPGWLTLPGDRDLAAGRLWHFFLAWVFVINGGVYLLFALLNGHLRRDLAPTRAQWRPRNILKDVLDHLRLKHPTGEEAKRYNMLQKLAYLSVIFVLLPLMVASGLTMGPGSATGLPWLSDLLGGRATARSIHFVTANLIVLFVLVHVIEVILAGPVNEVASMITGRYRVPKAHGGGR